MKKQNLVRNFFMVAMLVIGILTAGIGNNSYANSGYIGTGSRTSGYIGTGSGTPGAESTTVTTSSSTEPTSRTEVQKTVIQNQGVNSDIQIFFKALFQLFFG